MLLLVTLLLAPANAATLPAAVAVGSACSVEEPAIVLTETTGAVTDARIALSSWALGVDSRLPGLDGQTGISYALDHSAGLVNSRHGIMEYGCQGSMVAQKLLAYSLGFANVSAGCGLDGFRTIRQQLLATPQCPDGKSFAGEDHEFHRGYAGSFEATAEMILTARTFYAHTADRAVFLLNPERLLCVTPSGGDTAILVGAAKQGLKNTVCSESPLAMVARLPHVFSDNTNAPTAVTQTTHLTAHGKALLALNVSIKTAFTSIKLPLIQRGKSMWPFTVTITREDATPFVAQVCQKAFNASFNRKTWLSVSCGKTFAAGRYTIEVRPQLQSKADGMNPKDSYVFSVGWLTNARPKTSGSAGNSFGSNVPVATVPLIHTVYVMQTLCKCCSSLEHHRYPGRRPIATSLWCRQSVLTTSTREAPSGDGVAIAPKQASIWCLRPLVRICSTRHKPSRSFCVCFRCLGGTPADNRANLRQCVRFQGSG
eukprot:COSAG01_NODE_9016_length_2581_cov_71.843272_2_plen_484_part_00